MLSLPAKADLLPPTRKAVDGELSWGRAVNVSSGWTPMLTDEYRYRILKLLEADPEMNQRKLARELGISLGGINYCLRALIGRGLVKVSNFRNSRDKRAYIYLLTPKGIEEKGRITMRFLKYKITEYENLRKELDELRIEAARIAGLSDRHHVK